MRSSTKLLLLLVTSLAQAGPLEFGRAELNAALAERKMEPALLRVITEMTADPADSYRIEGSRIFGGDLRGLMYGLLEAAEQIRATGKLTPAKGQPACAIRAVRIAYRDQSKEFWTSYIEMLARHRFNRVDVIFPRDPNVERVYEISQAAADHGLDFVVTLEGGDLTAILSRCKNIRAVRLQSDAQQAFDPILRAGHLVTLEVEDTVVQEAARQAGVPVHISPKSVALSGDPDSIRRAVPMLTEGFELDAPSDTERSSLYMLWGRLSYDLKTPLKAQPAPPPKEDPGKPPSAAAVK